MKNFIRDFLFQKTNKTKKKKFLLNSLENSVCSKFDTYTIEEEKDLIEMGFYWNGRSLNKY